MHVKLNGVWYRLAEDAEGQHYVKSLQPLRPPNSQIVQGDSDRFQIRPDVLMWAAESWSGGEGRIKFSAQDPDSAFMIQHINPFERPGFLTGAYTADIAEITGSVAVGTGKLAIGCGNLWHLVAGNARPWSSTIFGAAEVTGATLIYNATGDANYLFALDHNTNNVYRRDSGGTWTLHNTQCTISGGAQIVEMGDYVYIWEMSSGEVYEISKATANTSTAETPIHYVPPSTSIDRDQALLVAGDNRIYVVTHDDQKTMVHEIIPSSASGTGYGYEVSTMYAVTPEAAFYAGGTLFIIAYDETPDNTVGPDRQIFYVDPQGSYGTLGSLRGLFQGTAGPASKRPFPMNGGKLGMMAFAMPSNTDTVTETTTHMDLWLVDLITGGFACVAGDQSQLSVASHVESAAFWEGKYFAVNGEHTLFWDSDDWTGDDGEVWSSANDFGLAGEKVLDSIEVVIEPLPSGATVELGYELDDGTQTYTDLGLSTNDTGGRLQISTDTSTKTFRSMRWLLKTTGTTDLPVVKAINVYARVNRRIAIWDLLLDASDDAAPQGYNGAQIIDNILGVADNTVIDFVDAYTTHAPGDQEAAADVVIDSAQLVASQKGEGIIAVRLMEVL